ncbi:MAG TPA: hypothetical protein VI461_06840 [Chitinophagaceae bacterium]|nr:hypothetical protein [Chitinophagaceae bacterium]
MTINSPGEAIKKLHNGWKRIFVFILNKSYDALHTSKVQPFVVVIKYKRILQTAQVKSCDGITFSKRNKSSVGNIGFRFINH